MKRALICAFVLAIAPLLFADDSDITVANVIAEMNVYRAAEGLPALAEDPRLTRSAQNRMQDMEDLGYWAHVAPDGRSPFIWLRTNGYFHAYAGENLASGFETVRVLVQGWMESPGHRANILSPLYNQCGVAIIDGGTVGRQTGKSVVVMFARERTAPQQAAK